MLIYYRLVCLTDKMSDWALWLVKSPIKLPAKGQLGKLSTGLKFSSAGHLYEDWALWGTIYMCVFFSCLNEHFHPFSRWSLFRYKCQWREAKTLVWLSEKQGQENRALAHINQWTPWFRVQWLRGSLSSGCPDARPFPTWCPCKAQQPVMDGSTLPTVHWFRDGASICSHVTHLLYLLYFFWCWACSMIVWLGVAFGLI